MTVVTTVRRRRVVLLGLLIVTAGVAFRAWSQRGVWFFFDDFNFIRLAAAHDLDWRYLTTSYNGHLMPAGNLVTWLNHELAPMDFRVPAAELLALFAMAAVGLLRLTLSLFGPRLAALVPVVFFCFTPILIPATTWWSAGVNYLPAITATLWALDAHVRYLRAPSRRRRAATVAWILAGLAFAEVTLFAYVFIAHVTLAYFASGSPRERLGQVLSDHRPAVLTHSVVVAGYLAVYIPAAMNFSAGEVTERPLFEVARKLFGTAFTSAVIGGPGQWRIEDVTQSAARPTDVTLIAGWITVALLVQASVATRRRGLRAWALPAVVLGASVALVSVSRAIYFGPEIALDYRFQTMAAPAMALALGLAFLPVLGATESAEPTGEHWLVDRRARVGIAMLAAVAFSVTSTGRYPMRELGTQSPQRYLQRLWATSEGRSPEARLINLSVPQWFWRGLDVEGNQYDAVFAPWHRRVPPVADIVVDDAYLVTDSGEVVPVAMEVARRNQAAAASDCAVPVPRNGATVALDGPVIGFVWFVRVTVTASAPTRLTVVVDGTDRSAEVPEGTHTLLLPGAGDYDRITVLGAPTGPDGPELVTCVTAVEVGTLRPDR